LKNNQDQPNPTKEKNMKHSLVSTLAAATALATLPAWAQEAVKPAPAKSPNIVFILTDDSGFGDFGCNGAKVVKTPNIDKLTKEGMRFNRAYCPSATCTPTRYSLLTGEYAWRKAGTGILTGDAALIIEPGRTTLPAMLRKAGYTTAAVGKWHLGLGDGQAPVDFNGEIKPGPLDIGFDYFFGMPATTDRVPCVYLENRRVVNLDPADPIQVSYKQKVGTEPTGKENPELMTRYRSNNGHDGTIINGIGRIGWMAGGKTARWQDELMARDFSSKACQFIERSKDQPFFLYFATHEPHVPRWPADQFRGKNPAGIRAESLEEMDWCIGEVMKTLDRLGIADNTLIIVTSDNGPAVADGYADGAIQKEKQAGHDAAGGFRGTKYTPYEGGVRMPFVARWPARIKAGTESSEVICHTDMLATMAALTGQTLGPKEGVDSFNVLDALTGEGPTTRTTLLVTGSKPAAEAIIEGDWKLVLDGARGGKKNTAKKDAFPGSLYNLKADPAEAKDVAKAHPEIAKRLYEKLVADSEAGFTRPGAEKLRDKKNAKAKITMASDVHESDI
jgi:arylsulfatase A-like enzyme